MDDDYYSPLKLEYGVKYDDTPRRDIVSLITVAPERVLEIGCGSGATGALVKQRFPGVQYFGLELVASAAAIARRRLDGVVVADIETVDLQQYGLQKESFDLVICADVLEHLYDPWKVLHVLRAYLKADGLCLASIPNTQNIRLLLHLLAGNWTYSEHGLLDATHIRFFTLNEIVKLFTGTGYQVVRCANILGSELEEGWWPRDLDFGRVVLKNVTREEANQLHTFQYFVVARKSHS
jgi:2-polyprenyl-3-methyl-5-hydroxy-6-metoxy-1,4-benzoquinol methylase